MDQDELDRAISEQMNTVIEDQDRNGGIGGGKGKRARASAELFRDGYTVLSPLPEKKKTKRVSDRLAPGDILLEKTGGSKKRLRSEADMEEDSDAGEQQQDAEDEALYAKRLRTQKHLETVGPRGVLFHVSDRVMETGKQAHGWRKVVCSLAVKHKIGVMEKIGPMSCWWVCMSPPDHPELYPIFMKPMKRFVGRDLENTTFKEWLIHAMGKEVRGEDDKLHDFYNLLLSGNNIELVCKTVLSPTGDDLSIPRYSCVDPFAAFSDGVVVDLEDLKIMSYESFKRLHPGKQCLQYFDHPFPREPSIRGIDSIMAKQRWSPRTRFCLLLMIGYNLIAPPQSSDFYNDVAMFLFGKSGCGKTRLAMSIMAIWPKECTCSVNLTMSREFSMEEFWDPYMAMAFIDDVSSKLPPHVFSQVLQIASGNRVSANRKRIPHATKNTDCRKIFFAGNEYIKVEGDQLVEALARRLWIFPFDERVEEGEKRTNLFSEILQNREPASLMLFSAAIWHWFVHSSGGSGKEMSTHKSMQMRTISAYLHSTPGEQRQLYIRQCVLCAKGTPSLPALDEPGKPGVLRMMGPSQMRDYRRVTYQDWLDGYKRYIRLYGMSSDTKGETDIEVWKPILKENNLQVGKGPMRQGGGMIRPNVVFYCKLTPNVWRPVEKHHEGDDSPLPEDDAAGGGDPMISEYPPCPELLAWRKNNNIMPKRPMLPVAGDGMLVAADDGATDERAPVDLMDAMKAYQQIPDVNNTSS